MQPHLSRGKIAFRPVRDDDRDFLLALYAETRAREFQGGLWPEADRDRFLTGQFDAQNRHYRAAFPGATYTIVQCGAADIGRLTADRQDDCLRIIDFIIAAAWRGQGIGSDILRALMHEAQGGKVPVRLSVEKASPALRLYRRLGFVPVGEMRHHIAMEWRPALGPREI